VVKDSLPGLENIAVKDYYNLVILETDAAFTSVPAPDYVIISDESPYRSSILYIDQLFNNTDTVFIMNFDAIKMYKKLKRSLDMFSINYLPAASGSSTEPSVVSLIDCGLNRDEPGVHMAMILGCTEIQYTGTSDNASTVTMNDIIAFTEEKDPVQNYIPKNFLGEGRSTVLNSIF